MPDDNAYLRTSEEIKSLYTLVVLIIFLSFNLDISIKMFNGTHVPLMIKMYTVTITMTSQVIVPVTINTL